MVVDDFRAIRTLVVGFLGSEYVCSEAVNGQEALLQVKLSPPDLIITDINMPVMDGMEFLRELRSHEDPVIAKIPVIVLSTNQDRESALTVGANAAVPKRLSARELRTLVDRFLQRAMP